jgi:hypothetical protein
MHKQDASRMRALASIICRLVAQGRLSFDAPTAYLIGARCLLLYKATKKGATSLLRVTWWFDLTVFGGDHGEERSADAASWRGPEGSRRRRASDPFRIHTTSHAHTARSRVRSILTPSSS